MTEPNAAPRSLIWSPLRWLVVGEVVLFALAAQLAFDLQPIAESASALTGSLQWQVTSAIAFGLFMTAALHALGMHAMRSRYSVLQVVMKYVASAGVAAGLLWVLLSIARGDGADAAALATGLVMAFGLLLLWRLFVQLLVDSAAMRRNVLVLGAGRSAAVFNDLLRRRSDRRGLEIVGYVPLGGDRDKRLPPARLLHSRTSLYRLCERGQVNEIVVAGDDRRGQLPIHDLLECRFHGITITPAASFVERECGRIPVELVEPSWWLYRKGFSRGAMNRVVKRAFDTAAGALILVLASPVMLACALAVRLEGGRGCSILFRQTRVGLEGREFRLVKFRSMREDAESDGVARWATSNDDRVTRVGRFLRKTRLDELPQLFNVLRGDMSLVGPRPERPEFVGDLARQIPWYQQRHVMRPGITGWAQLSYPYGASTKDALEKLKYDLYYIKNHNLLFDIAILLRTVEVVLFGKGAR